MFPYRSGTFPTFSHAARKIDNSQNISSRAFQEASGSGSRDHRIGRYFQPRFFFLGFFFRSRANSEAECMAPVFRFLASTTFPLRKANLTGPFLVFFTRYRTFLRGISLTSYQRGVFLLSVFPIGRIGFSDRSYWKTSRPWLRAKKQSANYRAQ